MSMKRISAKPLTIREYFGKLFQYRSLIPILAKRDMKAKYSQTLLGLSWTFLQPLTGVLIFTVLFGAFMKLDTGEMPYLLFAFSGVICWYLFIYIFNNASNSLLSSQEVIKKIYFPKLILPLSKVIVALLEFTFSLVLLFIVMAVMGTPLSIKVLAFPLFVLLLVLIAFTLAVWLLALTSRYRDLQHLVPYITNYAIWVTPVFYPVTIVPEKYHLYLYLLNPIALAIDGFRWSLLGGAFPQPVYFLSVIWIVALCFIGLFVFIRSERKLVDTL